MAEVSRSGPFTLDVESRRLERRGDEVHLTPKAFDLLHLLVSEAPRVIYRIATSGLTTETQASEVRPRRKAR